MTISQESAMSEPITVRRKRLIYRSRYRGCLESDLLFGGFADQYLMNLDPGQLDRYEALLEEGDQDILAWVFGRAPVPPEHDHDVFQLLRSYRRPARA
ncbi:MAG: succinate dehydrogenase assembly factor 2 [Pseudomonadota bacterium]